MNSKSIRDIVSYDEDDGSYQAESKSSSSSENIEGNFTLLSDDVKPYGEIASS